MRLPPSVAGYFVKLPPGQRLAWLLGASALLHVLAFQPVSYTHLTLPTIYSV